MLPDGYEGGLDEGATDPGHVAEGEGKRPKTSEEGGEVSGLHEAVTWLVYAIAAVVMISATAAAILFGLALGVAAQFLQELGSSPEEDSTRRHNDGGPNIPA